MPSFKYHIDKSTLDEGFISSVISSFVDALERQRWKEYEQWRNSPEYKQKEREYLAAAKKLKDELKKKSKDYANLDISATGTASRMLSSVMANFLDKSDGM